MSRRSRIRWSSSDEKELARLVKNYNAKINRITKKDPNMSEFLPDRVSKRAIKSGITTRSDLKREMKSLERFLKKGSEEVIFNNLEGEDRFGITKYEKREIEIKVATINRLKSMRRKEIEEMEVTSRSQKVGYKNKESQRMERLQMLQPKIFNFKTNTKKGYEHFKKGLEDADVYINMKDIILRDNYVDALIEHLGDNKYTKELSEKISKMNIDEFIKVYYSDKEAVIEFIYDPIQAATKLSDMYKVWGLTDDEDFEITDTEGVINNIYSQVYSIYDKEGRVIKRLGTERAAKKYTLENESAIEYKFEGKYSPRKYNRKKR